MNAFSLQVSWKYLLPNSLTACPSYIFPYISTKPVFLLNLDSLFRSVTAFERCRSPLNTTAAHSADAPRLPREAFVIDRLCDSGLQQKDAKKTHSLCLEQVYGKREKHIYILHIYIYVISLISVLIEGNHLSFEHVEVL